MRMHTHGEESKTRATSGGNEGGSLDSESNAEEEINGEGIR